MLRDSREYAQAKADVIAEVMGAACAADPSLNHDPNKRKLARIAVEVSIENWKTGYVNMTPEQVKQDLSAAIKPAVRKRLRDRRDDFGVVFVITMSMIFTWILQAVIVTAVAALVNWWINRKLERHKLLQDLSNR